MQPFNVFRSKHLNDADVLTHVSSAQPQLCCPLHITPPSSPLIPQLNKQPKLSIKSTVKHDNTHKIINTEATGAIHVDVHVYVCWQSKWLVYSGWSTEEKVIHHSPDKSVKPAAQQEEERVRERESDKKLWNIRADRWKCEWWMSRKRERERYSWVSKEIHMNEERLEEERWRESREEKYTQLGLGGYERERAERII